MSPFVDYLLTDSLDERSSWKKQNLHRVFHFWNRFAASWPWEVALSARFIKFRIGVFFLLFSGVWCSLFCSQEWWWAASFGWTGAASATWIWWPKCELKPSLSSLYQKQHIYPTKVMLISSGSLIISKINKNQCNCISLITKELWWFFAFILVGFHVYLGYAISYVHCAPYMAFTCTFWQLLGDIWWTAGNYIK